MDYNREHPQSDVRLSEVNAADGPPRADRGEPVPSVARQQKPPKPKSKHTVFKLVLFILFLLLASAALVYLYYDQKHENDALKTENDTLKGVNQTLEKERSSSAKPDQSVDSTTSTTYTSPTSKFTITLPFKYTVVRVVDGPAEGGPATRLQIGTLVDNTTNIVSLPALETVEVFAKPLGTNESFDDFVKNDQADKASSAKQRDATVAGVTAQVYTYDTLSTGKAYYFTKNGIVYKVSLDDTNSNNGQEALNEVLKNFKFN